MKLNRRLSFALAGALFAAGLGSAQDSVSKLQGLPGDAVSAYATTEQVNNFIVDLAPFETSWGTRLGIAPLLKSSQSSTVPQLFFAQIISSQCMSSDTLRDVPFAANSYSLWQGQGFGVNDTASLNDPGLLLDTSSRVGSQFAVAFAEFGGISNNVIGALVNFNPSNPGRLYVSRHVAAVNAPDRTCNLAQLGMGAIDAHGNIHFRADDFSGVANGCGLTGISGNNLYRVSMGSRTAGTLNILDGALAMTDGAATKRLLTNSPTAHNCPAIIPQSVASRPILMTGNFNTQFVAETTACTTTAVGTHLAFGASDQRGNLGYSAANVSFLNSTLGAASFFTKTSGLGGPTDGINLIGLGANGTVAGNRLLTLPSSSVIKDNRDGFDPSLVGPGQNQFMLYASQVAFRGGTGTSAVGVDQAGNLLAAGVVGYPTVTNTNNPLNYLAVARVNPSATITEWTIAAYTLDSRTGRGKPILTGPNGRVVGWQTLLSQVTGGSPTGPSMSAPMMDSVGNIYFLTAIEERTGDFSVGLVRAVLDPQDFSYDLELVLTTGQEFKAKNSNTTWQVRFLGIADSNSVSSGTATGVNINRSFTKGFSRGGLAPRSSRTLGGLVLNMEIVYDVNGDGRFDKVTGSGGNPASLDQEYQCLVYVGSLDRAKEVFNRPAAPLPGNPRPSR